MEKEHKEEVEPEEDILPVYDKEIMHPGQGELLVTRSKSYVALEKSWVRHTIFQNCCTIVDKVCEDVINNGSCENVPIIF